MIKIDKRACNEKTFKVYLNHTTKVQQIDYVDTNLTIHHKFQDRAGLDFSIVNLIDF